MHDSDYDIIRKVRAGDSRSYALIVDSHKDRALTLAVRLMGNREEAEELVQDAFVRAFNNLGTFRGDSKFSTWFYRILYNLCMTRVTRRRGNPERVVVDDETRLDDILVDRDQPSIHEQVEDEEIREIIATEIESLPEKFKAVITLFYVQELTYGEMVRVLNTPVGTVKTNLFRARNLLKERVSRRMKGEMKAV